MRSQEDKSQDHPSTETVQGDSDYGVSVGCLTMRGVGRIMIQNNVLYRETE